MKLLTLWQPWASLMLGGGLNGAALKTIETRSWGTSYRGPLVIHAASMRMSPAIREIFDRSTPAGRARLEYVQRIGDLDELPRGVCLGVVDLVGCLETDAMRRNIAWGRTPPLSMPDGLLGNFESGRYAWFCARPWKLEAPIPWRSGQRLRPVPDDLYGQIVLTYRPPPLSSAP